MKLSTKHRILARLCREAKMSPNLTIDQVSAMLSKIKAGSQVEMEAKIRAVFDL